MISPTPISTYHPDAGVVLTAWSDGSVTLTVAPAHPTWQHLCLPADVHLFRPVTRTYRQARLGIFDASGIVVRSKLASLVCAATEPMRLGEAESLRDGVLREWRALRAFALGFDSDASEQWRVGCLRADSVHFPPLASVGGMYTPLWPRSRLTASLRAQPLSKYG